MQNTAFYHLLTHSPPKEHEPIAFSFDLSTVPPPPDLTPYISKADDRYIAGGGFGDIYRCWYHDGFPTEVRTYYITLPMCHSPPLKVAVKAFRFSFTLDDDMGNRSHKVFIRYVTTDICLLICPTDAPPRTGNLEETGSCQCCSLLGYRIWVRNAWCDVVGVIVDAKWISPQFLGKA